jgi:hypothetical protein
MKGIVGTNAALLQILNLRDETVVRMLPIPPH